MNKKAEIFAAYLKERRIGCFACHEVESDPLNTVLFRSVIEVEGQELPTLVILDSSIYAIIRVRVANGALKSGNAFKLHKAINRLNGQYKIFKYYLSEDGALILDSYLLQRQEELDCDMLYTVLELLVKHLQDEYKQLMQLIWA